MEGAHELFNLFFDTERYDLSAVGRVKLNSRLEQETDDEMRIFERRYFSSS